MLLFHQYYLLDYTYSKICHRNNRIICRIFKITEFRKSEQCVRYCTVIVFWLHCNTGTTSTLFLSLPCLHKCADKKLIHYHYVLRCVAHFSCNIGGFYGNVYSCYGFLGYNVMEFDC